MMTENIQQQKKHTWLNRNVLGMGLGSLFGDMSYEMASAVLPIFIASTLGAPAIALGVIEGIADGIATLFEIWGGWLSDRVGKRKFFVVCGTIVVVISKASFGLLHTWWQVLTARTAGWIGWAIRRPARDALLAQSVERNELGKAFAFHRAMDRIGGILGPLCATGLLLVMPVRWIFAMTLIPGMCGLIALVGLVQEKPTLAVTQAPWKSVYALPAAFIRFLVPVGIFGIANFASTLLILRAQELLALSHSTAASLAVILYTWGNVVYVLASYPIGTLSDIVHPKKILGLGYGLFAVLCALFAFPISTLATLCALFALYGVASACVKMVQPSLAALLMGSEMRGTGYGVLSAVTGAGELVSSILIGTLWTYVSVFAGFMTSALIAAAACGALVMTDVEVGR